MFINKKITKMRSGFFGLFAYFIFSCGVCVCDEVDGINQAIFSKWLSELKNTNRTVYLVESNIYAFSRDFKLKTTNALILNKETAPQLLVSDSKHLYYLYIAISASKMSKSNYYGSITFKSLKGVYLYQSFYNVELYSEKSMTNIYFDGNIFF